MTEQLFRRILVPIDVAEPSRAGLKLALALAELHGSEIVVLSVVNDLFPYPDIFSFQRPNEDYYRFVRERTDERLAEIVGGAPHGSKVSRMISRGKPSRVIVEVAEEEACDLIILTSHTTHGLEHAILGSVTDRVLHTSSRPVLVVPIAVDGH